MFEELAVQGAQALLILFLMTFGFIVTSAVIVSRVK
jgi:hypothetical protein